MALIQFTALIAGIQGKINGSVISIGRSGSVIYDKPTQRKESTSSQLGIRSAFASASSAWNSLSLAQQENWNVISSNNPIPNRFGEPTIISGYAYFKRMMSLTSPFFTELALVPNIANQAPYQLTFVSSVGSIELIDAGFSVVDSIFTFTLGAVSTVENLGILYISLPVPNQNAPYFKTWYRLSEVTIPAGGLIGDPVVFNVDLQVLPSGFRSFENALHLVKAVSIIPTQGKVSVVEIAPFNPSWISPTNFPVFTFPEDLAISTDGPNNGIVDFAITSPFKAEIEANYLLQVQFAPSQINLDPVPEPDWIGLYQVGFVNYPFPPVLIPDVPERGLTWYGAWSQDCWATYNPFTDIWAPIRCRLYSIGTGETGPWVTYYFVLSAI
jgi:hypothetical protein